VDQDEPGVDQVERLCRWWVVDDVVPAYLERATGRGLDPRHVDGEPSLGGGIRRIGCVVEIMKTVIVGMPGHGTVTDGEVAGAG
jgi:hypothetical protein